METKIELCSVQNSKEKSSRLKPKQVFLLRPHVTIYLIVRKMVVPFLKNIKKSPITIILNLVVQ